MMRYGTGCPDNQNAAWRGGVRIFEGGRAGDDNG